MLPFAGRAYVLAWVWIASPLLLLSFKVCVILQLTLRFSPPGRANTMFQPTITKLNGREISTYDYFVFLVIDAPLTFMRTQGQQCITKQLAQHNEPSQRGKKVLS